MMPVPKCKSASPLPGGRGSMEVTDRSEARASASARALFRNLVLGALLLTGAPVWAHHAFEAEFDQTKPVTLNGKVTGMEWINPHSWIHIDVTDANGVVTNWMIECGSPNIMLRRGFTKRSLETGTEISVRGYQAKNGSNRANGSSITFKDGKKLFVGGSNPDLQEDQKK